MCRVICYFKLSFRHVSAGSSTLEVKSHEFETEMEEIGESITLISPTQHIIKEDLIIKIQKFKNKHENIVHSSTTF